MAFRPPPFRPCSDATVDSAGVVGYAPHVPVPISMHHGGRQVRRTPTAIIQPEGDLYVATCPHFDVVTQGGTIQEARNNLKEAVELFLECASPAEALQRRAR